MSQEKNEKLSEFHIALGKEENAKILSALVDMLQQNEELEKQFFRNAKSNNLMQYASDNLKSDKAFCIEQIKGGNSSFIVHASAGIKADREIGLLAVKTEAFSIRFLDESLKKDREIVTVVVKKHGRYVDEVDAKFKDDKEIAAIAVSSDPYSLPCFSVRLQNDPDIYTPALSRTGVLKHSREALSDNRGAVLVAAKAGDSETLRWASLRLTDDNEIALEVAKHGWGVDDASPRIKDLCKGKDPVDALTKAINYDNLTKKLAPTSAVEQPKNKLKI